MLSKILCKKCKKKVIFGTMIAFTILYILEPNLDIFAQNEFIKKENMWDSLHQKTVPNLNCCDIYSSCDYRDILLQDSVATVNVENDNIYRVNLIRQGGEYIPSDCGYKFSTAVIVPYYMNKIEHLHRFLTHMHKYLQNQQLHYRIFIVEQMNAGPSNRAKLLNIGALAAVKAEFPCLVLHDLELLPTQTSNIYACTKQPRHMSTTVNKVNSLLPFNNFNGGVISLTSEQFMTVNGLSNKYIGCDGDIEDLIIRLESHNYKLCRFDPEISRYNTYKEFVVVKESTCPNLLESSKQRMVADGINTLKYVEVSTIKHKLFTHIMVDI